MWADVKKGPYPVIVAADDDEAFAPNCERFEVALSRNILFAGSPVPHLRPKRGSLTLHPFGGVIAIRGNRARAVVDKRRLRFGAVGRGRGIDQPVKAVIIV